MFDEINKQIDLYYEGSSIWDIKYNIDAIIQNRYNNFESFYIDYLYDAYLRKDENQLENANLLMFKDATCVKNGKVIELYNKLLVSNWHSRQEDIISILEKFRDKSSINYLINSFDLKIDELSAENYYSFHRKLMWAIYKIGGLEYKETLLKLPKLNPELRTELKQLFKN